MLPALIFKSVANYTLGTEEHLSLGAHAEPGAAANYFLFQILTPHLAVPSHWAVVLYVRQAIKIG